MYNLFVDKRNLIGGHCLLIFVTLLASLRLTHLFTFFCLAHRGSLEMLRENASTTKFTS